MTWFYQSDLTKSQYQNEARRKGAEKWGLGDISQKGKFFQRLNKDKHFFICNDVDQSNGLNKNRNEHYGS